MSRQRPTGHIPGLADLIQIPDRYTAPGAVIEAASNALVQATEGILTIGGLLEVVATVPRPIDKGLLEQAAQLLGFLGEVQSILQGVTTAAATDIERTLEGKQEGGVE
ncbi:MAG: hypothetical protein WCY72_00525 [Lysobacteraceae bacterium]|nr:hypothetical protein [Gammaproteobacteria bacterium]